MAAALLVGCGSNGRELRAPAPGATAPPRSTSTAAAAITAAPIGLSISSPAWVSGEAVPTAFTCAGTGVSPPLVITGQVGAQELVVVVTDAANDQVHWVLAGLPPEGVTIPEGTVPAGAVVGLSSAGEAAWEPLCPEPGQTRIYEFSVHALGSASGITSTTAATDAQQLVSAAATSTSMLIATSSRAA
jgi:phosphatidylethanolamine-binding protein (PEBP) family uncharacterized protein